MGNKQEKRTYYCKKHKTFHRYLRGAKINQTYLKCLKSVYRFKDLMTNSELFLIDFRSKWTQIKANYYIGA